MKGELIPAVSLQLCRYCLHSASGWLFGALGFLESRNSCGAAGCAAAALGGALYVVGGRRDGDKLAAVERCWLAWDVWAGVQ